MRLLILGGTWFLGRTVAETALALEWEVTTFSRGLHGHDVPGTVPVRGRRENPDDVAGLASSGRWDVVVDASGYKAEAVDLAARMLRDPAERYVLVSTVNAFRGLADRAAHGRIPRIRGCRRWRPSPSPSAGRDPGAQRNPVWAGQGRRRASPRPVLPRARQPGPAAGRDPGSLRVHRAAPVVAARDADAAVQS